MTPPDQITPSGAPAPTGLPGRRRRSFVGAHVPDAPPSPGPELAPLAYDVPLPDGPPGRVDLSAAPATRLARDLAAAVRGLCVPTGTVASAKTVQTLSRGATRFLRWLARAYPDVRTLDALRRAHMDGFEALMLAAAEGRPGRWATLKGVVQVLRAAAATEGARADAELRERVEYTSRARPPKTTPRDAYSPYVAQQIRTGCKARMREVVGRLVREGPALLRQGVDPRGVAVPHAPGASERRVPGWYAPANLLWEIDRTGILTGDHIRRETGLRNQPVGLQRLHAVRYPTRHDLYPFFVLFCLVSRIPVECVAELTVGCLAEDADGEHATVTYEKRRAGERARQQRRVRTGGWGTPGGIVRMVLRLTQHARRHHPSDRLWLGYSPRPAPSLRAIEFDHETATAFSREIRLTGDDGAPLVLSPARLRKTGKAKRYVETEGRLADVADDHTAEVSFRHYLTIPRLRALHERAVADAQDAAVAALTVDAPAADAPTGPHPAAGRGASPSADGGTTGALPLVVPPDDEAALRADPKTAAPLLGVGRGRALPVIAGERDVFIAACREIRASPFSPAGEVCRAAVWGCLECGNAIFWERNLPNLLGLMNHFLGLRDEVPEEEWAGAYGPSYARAEQIVAAFPASSVLEARALAEGGEGTAALPYLPLELTAAYGPGGRAAGDAAPAGVAA